MDYNKMFNFYYLNYLGLSIKDLKEKKFIFQSNQREKPINNWYFQPLIITNIEGVNVFSISPVFYKEFKDYIGYFNNMDIDRTINILKRFFDNKVKNYTIRKMYRMTLDSDNMPKEYVLKDNVVQLTKEILMNNLCTYSDEEKYKVWSRKREEVNEGRQYVILDEHKIISYCKVSNIDFAGGNLTVFTNEKYRNKGYGKFVTIGSLKWCYENDIIPIYWVDAKNTYSVALAKSLGFKVKSEEIVVGTYLNE
ncbi:MULTISPECIES: GNAT family N-acetyltransferase [Clostridiaceae]|uniref:GNAT family N-acetyltransferase n=1 Tax=Clostridiaceae TaxID=31979 RepID=UPI000557A1C3|nr:MULTISPECIES: GNAT family N-acetyltransferase [Clostridiaceae]